MLISRSDRSKTALWFWTVDRWVLSTFLILISFGAFFIMASSPEIASKLKLENHFFTKRHLIFLFISLFIVFFLSKFNQKQITLFSIFGLIFFLILMFFTLINGFSAKGAQRWLTIYGFSLQPSEFVKPFFIIVNAWFLHLWKKNKSFKGWIWSTGTLFLISALLILQPDIGMTILIISVWIFQFFIFGIPLILLIILAFMIPIVLIFSYLTFDHVKSRIESFLNEPSYQTKQSLKSFESGSFFGKGLGEGHYKNNLPDAHTDFIFAVIGEEFGILLCCLILLLYSILVLRSLFVSFKSINLFFVLSSSGLAFLFGMQSIIHISSNIGLIPTKGMTLPFLSYGGSSTLSSAIIIGMLLSLTKKEVDFRFHNKEIEDQI